VRKNQIAQLALFSSCAALLFFASAGAALADQNPLRPDDQRNVFFRDLNQQGRSALQKACAAARGQVVVNEKGQLGCQVGSFADSKNISDGAAKGQANE
jgi:hypothetical protein